MGYKPKLLYFLAQIIPASVPLGAFSVGFGAPLKHPHQYVFFPILSYFVALQEAPGLSYIFPASVLESVVSSRIPASFYWRMVLETKIWALAMLVATEVSFLSGPLSW